MKRIISHPEKVGPTRAIRRSKSAAEEGNRTGFCPLCPDSVIYAFWRSLYLARGNPQFETPGNPATITKLPQKRETLQGVPQSQIHRQQNEERIIMKP
jgi:hypothetical protein